jgi:hypothetical protein
MNFAKSVKSIKTYLVLKPKSVRVFFCLPPAKKCIENFSGNASRYVARKEQRATPDSYRDEVTEITLRTFFLEADVSEKVQYLFKHVEVQRDHQDEAHHPDHGNIEPER